MKFFSQIDFSNGSSCSRVISPDVLHRGSLLLAEMDSQIDALTTGSRPDGSKAWKHGLELRTAAHGLLNPVNIPLRNLYFIGNNSLHR